MAPNGVLFDPPNQVGDRMMEGRVDSRTDLYVSRMVSLDLLKWQKKEPFAQILTLTSLSTSRGRQVPMGIWNPDTKRRSVVHDVHGTACLMR